MSRMLQLGPEDQHAKEHARLYGAGVSIPVVDKDIRNRLDDDNAEINFDNNKFTTN